MEININPRFGDMYLEPPEVSTSSYLPNETVPSSFLSYVGNRDGSCYVNGTREYEFFYRTAQFVTGLIIYPILCIIGIIGNSLSLIVLSHKDMATSTNVYLLALGVSDSLKLLNDFLYFIMLIISLYSPGAAETMMVNVYPYAHYVFQVAVCVTAWLTVSVAMDRYVSVCHPAQGKSLCTIVRARSMVITVFIIMILISIPSAFRYRLQTVHDEGHNTTCMELVVTELGRNKEFMLPYTWAQNLLRGIIPVFILIFLNARIINVLRKERVKGKKFSARNRITLMLIAMILVFIICITPDAIMSTFFGKGYVEEGFMVKGVREITDSLLALNSAVNFILYCSLSNLFRATFAKVFLGKKYISMRGGSCRQVSTYACEPTNASPTCGGGSGSVKRKNGYGKIRMTRKATNSTSDDSKTNFVCDDKDKSSEKNKRGKGSESNIFKPNNEVFKRNNSLCYTDHNDHLYAENSGVWLGPAPKMSIPKNSESSNNSSDEKNKTLDGNSIDAFTENNENGGVLLRETNCVFGKNDDARQRVNSKDSFDLDGAIIDSTQNTWL